MDGCIYKRTRFRESKRYQEREPVLSTLISYLESMCLQIVGLGQTNRITFERNMSTISSFLELMFIHEKEGMNLLITHAHVYE